VHDLLPVAMDSPPDPGDCDFDSILEIVSELAAPDRVDLNVHRLTDEPSRVRMEVCGVRACQWSWRQGARVSEEVFSKPRTS
jgi:hypothetical protein